MCKKEHEKVSDPRLGDNAVKESPDCDKCPHTELYGVGQMAYEVYNKVAAGICMDVPGLAAIRLSLYGPEIKEIGGLEAFFDFADIIHSARLKEEFKEK